MPTFGASHYCKYSPSNSFFVCTVSFFSTSTNSLP